ncbi:DUF6668 family protein [Gordonia sp. (in: high G+C Gram-positive bacteria)]|uniref:DUF6668 family protein n=1 Tax=Gordonia sp. (in: high G+C Gram-positive bacteria) TaxID=84139 RepID=UPI003C74EE7E
MTTVIDAVRSTPLPTLREFPPLFALVGAHGGSGATTLAAMWAPAADSERQWPASPASTQHVIVVAREHMAGIRAAAQMLRDAEAGRIPAGIEIHGLLTVAAKPGKGSRPVLRYARTIAELAPNHWRIGWVEELLDLLPDELPVWFPGDPVRVGRRTADGTMATVPSAIAEIGFEISTYFAGIRPAIHR